MRQLFFVLTRGRLLLPLNFSYDLWILCLGRSIYSTLCYYNYLHDRMALSKQILYGAMLIYCLLNSANHTIFFVVPVELLNSCYDCKLHNDCSTGWRFRPGAMAA